MNKLINKLSEQALDHAALVLTDGLGGIAEFNRLYTNKFAELLVQDCVTKLYNNGYDDAANCLQQG